MKIQGKSTAKQRVDCLTAKALLGNAAQKQKQHASEHLSPKIANKIFKIVLTQFSVVGSLNESPECRTVVGSDRAGERWNTH